MATQETRNEATMGTGDLDLINEMKKAEEAAGKCCAAENDLKIPVNAQSPITKPMIEGARRT